MKLAVKKTYCPSCRRLVRGIEQRKNGSTSVKCSLCGRELWVWNGYSLRRAKKVL